MGLVGVGSVKRRTLRETVGVKITFLLDTMKKKARMSLNSNCNVECQVCPCVILEIEKKA